MGKQSTPSKSKAKRSKSSSSSSKRSKLYCSKVVGTILDKLIETELTKAKKHPKTVGKWMAKMRSSILKKISAATPFLFKSEKHDMAALDAQLVSNLKNIEANKTKIVASSRKMWQENFDYVQRQANQDASKSTRQGGKKNTEKNIFSDKVTKLNENIDEMASQLSSIGKDIENRVMSLNSSIQAAEKLWASNPMRARERGVSTSSTQRSDDREQEDDSDNSAAVESANNAANGVNKKNRVYRDLDVHLNEY